MEPDLVLQKLRTRAFAFVGNGLAHDTAILFPLLNPFFQALPQTEYAIPNPSLLTDQLHTLQQQHQLPSRTKWSLCPDQVISITEMKASVNAYEELHATTPLTSIETQLSNRHVQVLVGGLLDRCLNHDAEDKAWEELRLFLLELIINPTSVIRSLGFQLIFNLSLQLQARELLHLDPDAPNDPVQSNLYGLLLEMLDKYVVIDPPNSHHRSSITATTAIGCLLYFTCCRECISAERVAKLDPQLLSLLINYVDPILNPKLELQLVQLLICGVYLNQFHAEDEGLAKNESRRMTSIRHQLSTVSAANARKLRPACVSWKFPDPLQYDLNPDHLRHFGGLDVLVHRFWTCHSIGTRRLLFMMFYDIACFHLRQQPPFCTSTLSHGLEFFNVLDLDGFLQMYPTLCLQMTSLDLAKRIWKKHKQLNPSCQELLSKLDMKVLAQVLDVIQNLIRVKEYYYESASLKTAINILKQKSVVKKMSNTNSSEGLLARIDMLLNSHVQEETYKGQRWLAQLLAQGPKLEKKEMLLVNESSSVQDPSVDLEETLVVDQAEEVRSLAKTKFWDLAKSSKVHHRLSFVAILIHFTRRTLEQLTTRSIANVIQQITPCIKLLWQSQESDPRVLIPVVHLLFQLCCRPYSYIHGKWLRKTNGGTYPVPFTCPTTLRMTDTLMGMILNGEAVLDRSLIGEVPCEFFIHVIRAISAQTSPASTCEGGCCGTISNMAGDTIACCAFIVRHMSSNTRVFHRIGGLKVLLPLLEMCDARVAVFMAELLKENMRQTDIKQYEAALNGLLLSARATADSKQLTNSYLQCRAILPAYRGATHGNNTEN